MRTYFYFVFVMVIGFLVFVPTLILVVPLIGLPTFFIIIILLILGFLVEPLWKNR